MVRIIGYWALLLSVAPTLAQTTRPISGVDHVLIISVDGLRPDVLLRADTPNLRRLMKHGAFTLWAYTVPVAITLPSHASMVTGVTVEKHGLDFNDERATTRPIFSAAPTIFELAKQQGYTTALVSGKSKFISLAKLGTVDWLALPAQPHTEDEFVVENAVKIIREHRPDVMFVHFPGADTVGHAVGWGTQQQLDAIALIDADIGQIIHAMQEEHLIDRTLILISADHGGSGRVHGEKVPDSINIPWIASNPALRQDYDLTLISDLRINTYDTFATACWALNIPLPGDCDGKPIQFILPGQEMLVAEPKGAATGAISRGTK